VQDFIEKVFRNFLDFFNSLETGKKIGMIAVGVVIVASIGTMIVWATKTRFEVLYTDLNRDDSKKVAQLLEEARIPYQTTSDGRTIMIPREQVNRFRLEIATLGVNFSGTVGYEVFDKQSFGTTSFVQRVNRQRALEGELIKTISHIRGINRSRVHLNIPESSPFVAERRPPSASVVLDLDRGVELTKAEVQGIAHLVASSVEGMRPETVVILDDRGKRLSENQGDALTANTSNRLALESQLNRQYERQIEEILSRVVGEGRVIAKVAVRLDFTESISTETSFDGENAAVLSEVSNTQQLHGSRPSPQGIPGARSNLPGEVPQPGIPETRNDVNKELTTRNFNVPSRVTKSKNPTGNISQITAAVMIDGKRVPIAAGAGGEAGTRYEQWSEADLANFRAIVASALGLNERRGDAVTIKNMEFAQEDLDSIAAMMREQERRELIKNIAKYSLLGLIVVLFFFLVVRPFIQWITDNTVESVEDFLPRTLEELERVQANQKLPGLEDALPQIEEKLNPEKIEGNMLREKIISLVEANPSKAAQVVHEMIHSTENDKQIA
jgi:flagellar M-ring protein FliF